MGRIRPVAPVKLVCGLLGGDADLLRRARQLLTDRFGPVDLETALLPFHETDYYADEMGSELHRVFLSFERMISPQALGDIKRETNALEEQLAEEALDPLIARPVNIDPGYVDAGKLVLGTTKDRSHRICISTGIYAEVTLEFVEGAWRAAIWTYPDYRRPDYHTFFEAVRARLLSQRRAGEPA